jgi:hypothetical protein
MFYCEIYGIDWVYGFIVSNQWACMLWQLQELCFAYLAAMLHILLCFHYSFHMFVCCTYICFLMNDSEHFIIKIYLKQVCRCAVFSTVRILWNVVINVNEGLLCPIKISFQTKCKAVICCLKTPLHICYVLQIVMCGRTFSRHCCQTKCPKNYCHLFLLCQYHGLNCLLVLKLQIWNKTCAAERILCLLLLIACHFA